MTLKNAVTVLLKMIFRIFSFLSECCADFVVAEDSMQRDLFLFLSFAARLYVKKFIQSRCQSNQLRGAESLSEGAKI